MIHKIKLHTAGPRRIKLLESLLSIMRREVKLRRRAIERLGSDLRATLRYSQCFQIEQQAA